MDEGQIKSGAPRLTQIATQILTGLLASGDYTEEPQSYRPYSQAEPRARQARYRLEAVSDAIELARQIIEKTKE